MTEHHEREKWGSKIEFMLASIGWAVGYGNVWRFPYKCYQYGGGVFLIPYVASLVFAGVPMYALELAIGQYSSLGPNQAFRQMAPVFHGIGWGTIVISALVAIYFNMLISYSIWYFLMSFRSKLLWSTCENDWNTDACHTDLDDARCEEQFNGAGTGINYTYWQKECYNSTQPIWGSIQAAVGTLKAAGNLTNPADEYYTRMVVQQSASINEPGIMLWHLVLCQALAWLLVFACVCYGVKTTGKVVYFTATFPYVLITILLIRGVTLDGAGDGIYFYLKPDFEKLLDAKVWQAAAVQIFYTYGVAFGVIITFASYNEFHSNVLCDAYTICLTDSCTSFYTGFAVFSTAGFMAKTLGRSMDKVVRNDSGLAFVVFAEAVARMPWGPFWSIVFFFMMILIGIDSQFPMLETPATAIMDEFPKLRKHKPLVFGTGCFIGFLLGLPMCMQWGTYWFTLIENYSAGWCLILLSLSEVLVAMYLYGYKNVRRDIELMTGKKPTWMWVYWFACWMVITPVFLFVILLVSLIQYEPSKVAGVVLPDWGQAMGWLMAFASVLMVPLFAIYHIVVNRKNNRPLNELIKPTAAYIPADERHKVNGAQQPNALANPAATGSRSDSIPMQVNKVAPSRDGSYVRRF